MSDRPPTPASQGGERYRTAPAPNADASKQRPAPGTRQRRLMSRAVPLVVLAVGAFAIGIAIGASSEESQAAQSFADAWERQDFEAMHAELSPAVQEEYPLEAFTRHYVAAQATGTAIEVRTGEISVEDDAAAFPATVETNAF